MSSHPFSKAAVEAAMLAFATKQFYEGMTDNNPFASAMDAALSAAFEHAREEGKVRCGFGWEIQEGWEADTYKQRDVTDFSVTIIKDAGE